MAPTKQESSFARAMKSIREDNWGRFFSRMGTFFHWKIFGFLFLNPYASMNIASDAATVTTPEAATKFVFTKYGGLLKPMQYEKEIITLAHMVQDMKPQVIVEIGTAFGGTLFIFTRVAPESADIISIDQEIGYPSWREAIYQKFTKPNQHMHLLRLDSHEAATVRALEEVLKGKKIDFLFIDSDHTYEGVKKDYELFSPLVREGGLIAFHDIKYPKGSHLVEQFWDEVKGTVNSSEIVGGPESQPWGGIGLIHKV